MRRRGMCVETLLVGGHRETNTGISDQIPSGEVGVAAVEGSQNVP